MTKLKTIIKIRTNDSILKDFQFIPNYQNLFNFEKNNQIKITVTIFRNLNTKYKNGYKVQAMST